MKMINDNTFPSVDVQYSRNSVKKVMDSLDAALDWQRRNRKNENDVFLEMMDNIRSDLSKFLIIRSCGYLEKTLLEASRVFAYHQASPGIRDYISHLEAKWKSTKADSDRILKIVSYLSNNDLDENFKNIINDNSTEIKSMITYRNKIAHGTSEQSTPDTAIRLAQCALTVGKEIERQLKKELCEIKRT